MFLLVFFSATYVNAEHSRGRGSESGIEEPGIV